MHRTFAERLVVLAAHDLATRERLAGDGSLFEGYHPEMQAVNDANARELEAIIADIGWPHADLVGEDGAEAAWLIAQHAIGWPRFQRQCLERLRAAVDVGKVPAWQMAMMLDRIRTYEGHAQVYGTSFDWDERGRLSPRPIEDPAFVDQRRAAVGLEPLEAAIAKLRARDGTEHRPADLAEHRRRMDDWARSVGWR